MKGFVAIKQIQRIIFLSLLIALTATVSAKNNEEASGTISGKVLTADGRPAADVTVRIKELKKSGVTDEDGQFAFTHIPPGKYTIEISLVGYETVSRAVEAANHTAVNLSIQLKLSEKQLQEVTVVSARSQNQKTATIGKAGIAAKDLPQSVVTIDREVLERQQVLTVGDALMNVNGVYVMGTTGGTQQEIGGRGYLFNSTNTFKNGMKFNNSIMPDMSSVEKLEFLKGSAAILMGNVTAGGVMNLVTKKPLPEQGGEISFRAGSYDFYKPTLDIYGPVGDSKSVSYRIVSSYEKERSFRKSIKAERYYINPSFLIKAGKRTQILVEGDYLSDSHVPDFGVGAINYVINNIPRNTFLGAAWSNNKATESNISVTTTHQLNNNWQLRNITGYYNYTVELYGNTRPNDGGGAAIQTNGNWVRGVQHTTANENYYITQLDLIGRFTTGSVGHQFLFGASTDKVQTNTLAYNLLAVYDSINVFNLSKYAQRADIPALTKNTYTQAPITTAAAYIQDLISFTKNLKLLVGGRIGYIQSISDVYTYATGKEATSAVYAHPFTPRAGLVFQPVKNISLFASYSNSFNTNTGTDTAGKALPLSFINQYEIGFKSDVFNRLVSFNITAYQIVNSNLAQTSLANGNTNTNIKELAGQVTSKGVEIDITTKQIHGFNVMAGYSYNNSRYTKSNTYFTGSKLQYAPANIVNASIYYTCSQSLQGLSFGLAGTYVNGMMGGRVPRVNPTATQKNFALIAIPDFTRIDATARYMYKNLSFALKCSNVFDVLGYYAHEDGSVNPIAPTQFAATVSCRL